VASPAPLISPRRLSRRPTVSKHPGTHMAGSPLTSNFCFADGLERRSMLNQASTDVQAPAARTADQRLQEARAKPGRLAA
jgi:hypothetical protein